MSTLITHKHILPPPTLATDHDVQNPRAQQAQLAYAPVSASSPSYSLVRLPGLHSSRPAAAHFAISFNPAYSTPPPSISTSRRGVLAVWGVSTAAGRTYLQRGSSAARDKDPNPNRIETCRRFRTMPSVPTRGRTHLSPDVSYHRPLLYFICVGRDCNLYRKCTISA